MLRTDASGTNSARQGYTKDTTARIVICNGLAIHTKKATARQSRSFLYRYKSYSTKFIYKTVNGMFTVLTISVIS